ncbi:MAG: YtxH domain-containing protein [Actinobacteria bacterium]|nr:YtxH domain-containing protein [Actinomycetota bacterium]
MNDQDKQKEQETKPEVLEKNSATKGSGGKFAGAVAVALFSGVVIGLVTGVLFAPKKGQKTRKEIADKSKELVERSKNTFTGTIDKTKEFTREGKSKLDRVINIITPKKKNKQNKKKEE